MKLFSALQFSRASPRLGASAEPHQLERRRTQVRHPRLVPGRHPHGQGHFLSHDEMAILKGLLDELEL